MIPIIRPPSLERVWEMEVAAEQEEEVVACLHKGGKCLGGPGEFPEPLRCPW